MRRGRLAGIAVPSFADTETTFAELRAHRQGDRFPEDDPAHAVRRRRETRTIELPSRDRVMTFDGKSYRLGFALPNCYFRTTIAYDILRLMGVRLGRMGYPGGRRRESGSRPPLSAAAARVASRRFARRLKPHPGRTSARETAGSAGAAAHHAAARRQSGNGERSGKNEGANTAPSGDRHCFVALSERGSPGAARLDGSQQE
nr:DUF1993 family protein [Burkholderia thailandensis]